MLVSLLFFTFSHHDQPQPPILSTTAQTQMALRDLWVEHVFWVRNYVIARHSGNQNALKTAENEIVANAKGISNSIVPFYGEAAAETLFGLLAGHWGAVKAYADASLPQSNEKAREKAVDDLTKNAIKIADFLSSANPHLPKQALISLLSAHGAHHIAQINQIQQNQFLQEAKTWHEMRHHMLMIADALVGGIAKQFPDQF